MPVATLTITMNEKGVININGPIDDKLLCYGLLEVAKEAVKSHNDAKTSGILRPDFTLPALPGGGRQ